MSDPTASPPADWRAWLGRTEQQADTLTAAPLAGLAALLDDGGDGGGDGGDGDGGDGGDGTEGRGAADDRTPGAVPPLAHWLYFLGPAPQHRLGPDGHPRRGGFLPPIDLPRRMWAGGRLRFERPLAVGDAIVRRSTIAKLDVKDGRSGRLVFVTVRHEIEGPAGVAIREEQDIVYRDAPVPGAAAAVTHPAPTLAPADATFGRTVAPDPVLLFRYSALTFNGHRIHYDRPYATDVEGYPGLVVHGPLVATLLVDLVRRARPDATVRRFEFRAARPLCDLRPFSIAGRPDPDGSIALWARDPDGALAMQARAELA